MIVEFSEIYTVTLERTADLNSKVTIDPVNARIQIIDDDSKII